MSADYPEVITMISVWDNFTTKDKVLAVLCDNMRLAGPLKVQLLQSKFPYLSHDEIVGILWHLQRENFVRIQESASHFIESVTVHYSAISYLREKRENRAVFVKWDIIKIVLSFALGFASAWLLK